MATIILSMMPASNIITSIVADIQKHSSKAILKSFVGTLEEPKWETLTYGEFLQQLNDVASFWIHTLGKLDIPPGCVVGLWFVAFVIAVGIVSNAVMLCRITGKVYTDLVHIYGLMRAGYIPQASFSSYDFKHVLTRISRCLVPGFLPVAKMS